MGGFNFNHIWKKCPNVADTLDDAKLLKKIKTKEKEQCLGDFLLKISNFANDLANMPYRRVN